MNDKQIAWIKAKRAAGFSAGQEQLNMHIQDPDGKLYRLRRQQERRDVYILAAFFVAAIVGLTFVLTRLIP